MATTIHSQNFGTTSAAVSTIGWLEDSPDATISTGEAGFTGAYLEVNSSTTLAMATSSSYSVRGYYNIQLSVSEKWTAANAGDSFTIEYSINGGSSWIEVVVYDGTQTFAKRTTVYNLSLSTSSSPLKIRFSVNNPSTIGTTVALVDDILILGQPSITIKDTPQQYEPAHNDLAFVISGTNNTSTNYKYWCDVWFAGSSTYDYRLFTFPRPDGFGFFNLKTILRDFVDGDIDIPSTEGFYQCTNMHKPYYVYFGESEGTSGAVSSGLSSSGTYYAFDGSLEWDEFIAYSQNDRAINSTSTLAKFLTNAPQDAFADLNPITQNTPIGDSENAWIYMAVKAANVCKKISIVTLNSALSVIGTYTVTNPYSLLTSNNDRFLRFPSGTANLDRIPTANISGSATPIISGSVKYYLITVTDNSGVATSETIAYEVRTNCSKYTTYRLHYKNKWGGFDSFTFTGLNRESGNVERKSYKKQYGTISSAGNWSYTKKDRGITNYSTKSKRGLRLISDWVTEAQYELLIELIESPQVYWDNSGELHAVNILNSSYEVKTISNNKLLNLELEVEFTQMNRRQ